MKYARLRIIESELDSLVQETEFFLSSKIHFFYIISHVDCQYENKRNQNTLVELRVER